MMYYAVIDTNVLISGMLKKPSIPNEILVQALVGNIVPLINEKIMAEYKEVTARPKFHFPQVAVRNLLTDVLKRGIWQNEEYVKEDLPDPKDRIFFETVVAGRKFYPAYLITGNLKHFPDKDFVVTPHKMLDILST